MARSKKPKIVGDTNIMTQRIRIKYGEGAVFVEGEDCAGGVEFLPTQSGSLNDALGGGLPWGRIVEIYGPESSGKTSLALHACAQAQRLQPHRPILYIDAENALSLKWCATMGVDMKRFHISQTMIAEDIVDLVNAVLEDAPGMSLDVYPSVIVVDSIAAATPRAILNGEADDVTVAAKARVLSTGVPKWVVGLSRTNTLMICINQQRAAIGQGNRMTTSGGKALPYYASQRLKVWGSKMKTGPDAAPFGIEQHIKVEKNKVASPFREGTMRLFFDCGVDANVELLEYAIEVKAVQLAGSWVKTADGTVLGQGKSAAAHAIATDSTKYDAVLHAMQVVRNHDADPVKAAK